MSCLHFEVPLTTALMCRKAKAIELMVVDAMLEADVELRISERIHDPDLFVTLDDTLLRQIEVYGLLPGLVCPVPEKIVSMELTSTLFLDYLKYGRDLLHSGIVCINVQSCVTTSAAPSIN